MLQEFIDEGNKNEEFFTHIKRIGEIAQQAGGINDLFFDFARPHLEFLQSHLNTSKIGTAFFALLVYFYDGSEIYAIHFARQLNCKIIDIMSYLGEFEILEKKRLIHINREEEYRRHGQKLTFEVRFQTIDSLRKGNYDTYASVKYLTNKKFFNRLDHLCEDRVRNRISYLNTIKLMNDLLDNNRHLVFVKKIINLNIPEEATLILILFFCYLVSFDQNEIGYKNIEDIYDYEVDFNFTKKQLQKGNHILLSEGLIENTFNDGFDDTENFRLTEAIKNEFLVELDMEGLLWNISPKGLKKADSIAEKKLFYPEKTQEAIMKLGALLEDNHFSGIQKRLSENGMRTGFACLFWGSPGTGKTETAYQIARMTGRDIMHVDISSTKSKWFGESEKLIKSIFEKYRGCVKKCETTPILLFNEADAIFGKRQLLGEKQYGPAQTENAIQNIILHEIENLNGILIATTNLSGNFDTAFERRFLYKIEFEKPEAEVRKAIWRSLISCLSDQDAKILASRFDFSGGQIENIARKSTVHQILEGRTPELDNIIKFCKEENLTTENTKRIGFVGGGQCQN